MKHHPTGLFPMRGSPPLRASRPSKRLGWGAVGLALVGALLVVNTSAVAADADETHANGLAATSVSEGVELT